MIIKSDYIELIENQDKTLSSLAALWREETNPQQKDKLMSTINIGLDERLRLMTLRDALS